jgi:hypothetical protein
LFTGLPDDSSFQPEGFPIGERAMLDQGARFIALACAACLLLGLSADARVGPTTPHTGKTPSNNPHRVLVIDGSNVHDVGELNMHIGNWGLFGSMPGSAAPFADAPSAEWPSGSGVEYLYASGLWVGAIKNGVPAVSTSSFEFEMRPTEDPIDIIYRSTEGAANGKRHPDPDADDDGDGMIDEDWLNGRDDDGDGMIDEDFAAVSNQMFSCWHTDNQPTASEIYPQHNPLDIMLRQETYQWSDDGFDDFIGVEFTITNIGTAILEDIYLGCFVDPDCGPRNQPGSFADDATGFYSADAICTESGGFPLDIGYAYDADGDGGQTTGYFGVLALGHPVDPFGTRAPERVQFNTYAHFSGDQSFEEGGDPTNDFERYELLSQQTIERSSTVPRDFRYLVGVGPFSELRPGDSMVFQFAFVVGAGLDGMVDNAIAAKRLFRGTWYDVDGDPTTGVRGREFEVVGPATNVQEDRCQGTRPIPNVPRGVSLWVNHDCEEEERIRSLCGFAEADSALYRTGVGGKETQAYWNLPGLTPEAVAVAVDIKPGMCPNRFRIRHEPDRSPGHSGMATGGVFSVGVLGSNMIDVLQIDPSSITLAGVPAIRWKVRDRIRLDCESRGHDHSDVCLCTCRMADGFDDLLLVFRTEQVVAALGDVEPGDVRVVQLTGEMFDGTIIEGSDCVVMSHSGRAADGDEADDAEDGDDIVADGRRTRLRAAPNPFNPVTRISYTIPRSGHVRLAVWDVTGRLVERLVDRPHGAGEHFVIWDAGSLPSGIYFYRLETDEWIETRKLILLK